MKYDRNLHIVIDMFDISELRKEENELVTLGDSPWVSVQCFGLIQVKRKLSLHNDFINKQNHSQIRAKFKREVNIICWVDVKHLKRCTLHDVHVQNVNLSLEKKPTKAS